jgi:hypothetical protein
MASATPSADPPSALQVVSVRLISTGNFAAVATVRGATGDTLWRVTRAASGHVVATPADGTVAPQPTCIRVADLFLQKVKNHDR